MPFYVEYKLLPRLKGIVNTEKFSNTANQNSNKNFNLIQFCSNTLAVNDQHYSGFDGGPE